MTTHARTHRARTTWTALALAAMLAAHAAPAAATNRIVDPAGSDTGDCSATACATIQFAVDASVAGDVIEVHAGTYIGDIVLNKSVHLQGAGYPVTTISGAIGGAGSTIQVAASGVVIEGVTITREGNNPGQWNGALNTAGVAVQGQANDVEIHDCRLFGNRTGIDINDSDGNIIRNNIISDNRTGLLFRNRTNSTVVVENEIADNWTVGVLFLDASGGTNSPVQSALLSTFSNNDISGNWYGQIADRQSGGSLPAPPANPKNFAGNWLGTAAPVVTTANTAEPGYNVQIPVAYGGTAVPPGGQPDVAGSASANLIIRPLVTVPTDSDIETTVGRGVNGFQGLFGDTIEDADVARQAENTAPTAFWVLYNRNVNSTGTFMIGPATPPLGVGSLELMTTGAADKITLFNYDHIGTRLATVNEIRYSTYRTIGTLQQATSLNIQVNPNGPNNGTFATLVYEPVYNPSQGAVQNGIWQAWDAFDSGNALWWATRDLYDAGNVLIACNPNGALANLPQCAGKLYVSWATIVAGLPNAFISGGLGLNQGSGGDALTSSVDGLTIGVPSYSITYDFDHQLDQTITFDPLANKVFGDAPFAVSALASSSLPVAFSAAGACTVSGNVVTLTGGGSCTITASQPGDAVYNPAPDVAQSFSIAKAAATLTLSDLAQIYTGTPRLVTVTSAPLPLGVISVTYDGSPTAPSAVGSYAVVASLNNPDYEAPDATGTLVIVDNRTSQVITAPNISAKTTLSNPFSFTAYATSELEVTFSADGPCTVAPTTNSGRNWTTSIDVTGAGSCTITMLQAGDAVWAPALATRTFSISKVNQKITFGTLATKYVTDAPFTVSASVNSGLPLTFVASGPCTLSGATPTQVLVTLTGVPGTCAITASQAGDGTYNAAPSVTRTFTVNSAVILQSLTVSPSSITGGCTVVTGKVILNINTPVDVNVTLTSTNGAVAGVPATVTVLAGQKQATFAITTAGVAVDTTATLTATLDAVTVPRAVTVRAPRVLSVALAPSIVAGGLPSTATVTLNCAAPAGGLTVAMSSTKPARAAVASPTAVVIGGQSTVVVGVTTTAGALDTANIRASANGTTKSATLTITP